MVGNYVLCHDHGWYTDGTTWEADRICKVVQVNEIYLTLAYDDDGDRETGNFKISECEGIPITVDILEKIGFRQFVLGQWLYMCKEKDQAVTIVPDISNLPNSKHRCLVGIGNGYTNAKIALDYLHELQNAFRVCGIEEITLKIKTIDELRLQYDIQG